MNDQYIIDTIATALYVCGIDEPEKVEAPAVYGALKGAGYAVVELPDDIAAALHHYDLEVIPRDDGVPPIRERGGWEFSHFTPSEARRRAAALLAAADAAEADQ